MHDQTLAKNSADAIENALKNGFGVETDIRDQNGIIVVSHDPPINSNINLSFRDLLQIIKSYGKEVRVALNIKSDGLSSQIVSEIKQLGLNLNMFFVFDMSIPDSLDYVKSELPCYSRSSEFECIDYCLNDMDGVWVDNLTGSHLQIDKCIEAMHYGKRATFVSPELHGRQHLSVWTEIQKHGIYMNPLFEICTDFPSEANSIFCCNK